MYSPTLKSIPAPDLAATFCAGEFILDIDPQSWIDAFRHVDENIDQWTFDREKMHLLWTVNGGSFRRKIQDDALILRVLRAALPGYHGPALHVYRGECQSLYDQGKIGFCWSSKIETAKFFASGVNCPGVVLKAFAPPGAILAPPNAHSTKQMQELEYTCDPTQLIELHVLHSYDENSAESETGSILWDFLDS